MRLHPDDIPWRPLGPLGRDRSRRLRIRWLGTAGYELTCDGVSLLIDPYLTRASIRDFALGPIEPDRSAIRRWVSGADGIVVSHSHFDHLVDVPAIAKMTGARVWGSVSAANLLRASGVPEAQVAPCEGGETAELGPFRIELVPSRHSRFGLGGKVPFAGDIPPSCEIPLRGHEYRCGRVFGISIRVGDRSLYHLGSANLLDEAITVREVDLALVCISARQVTERFVPRLMHRLRPRRVVPMHYDNFFRSLDRPMAMIPRVHLGRFVDEVKAFDRAIELSTLRIGESVELGV